MNYLILGFIFLHGYLFSRLFLKYRVAGRLAFGLLRLSRKRWSFFLFYLILAAALLSTFMPNMIAVLTLIPIVEDLARRYHRNSGAIHYNQLITPLGLALIFGANIGGMGSLIGSPANAFLLTGLEIFDIPGREKINFFSWFHFSLPLTFVFLLVAWGVLWLGFHRRLGSRAALPEMEDHRGAMAPRERWSVRLSASFFLVWVLISAGQTLAPDWLPVLAAGAVVAGLAGLVLFFVVPFPLDSSASSSGAEKKPLLIWQDVITDLPVRGIVLLGVVLILGGGLYFVIRHFQVPGLIEHWVAQNNLADDLKLIAPFWLFFALSLITTFSTEILSNTAVAFSLFPVVFILSVGLQISALEGMMVVSLASTCAFMSPVATPVNALTYGSLRGMSLKQMLLFGALTNVLGGIWIALVADHLIRF